MKLSVMNPALYGMNFEDACKYLHARGVQAVEVGCGGFPGKKHCDPEVLLNDNVALQAFKDTLKRNELELAALSTHGNPVHPDPDIAKVFHDDFVNAVLLAEKLGIDRVVTFSGCPGGSKHDKMPNWVTCAWPEDNLKILDYQWDEVLIPYWQKTARFAADHGVQRIAFEMHPGFCVYNPYTMLRLREAAGKNVGANLDPSHLYWQGMDPVQAIKELGDAIFFVHAKDTYLDRANVAVNGVLDYKHYSDPNRSWVFRTVGYGHDALHWKQLISALRAVGYDDVISIEHEDAMMSIQEGLDKAIRFLQDVLMFEAPGKMYWA